MEEKNILNLFHPVIKEWFEGNIGKPSPPQEYGWPAIQRGENVLISAPTGAGKTLTAFLVCINNLFLQGIDERLDDGVQILYISPLKALNNDIYRNLEVPLEGIKSLCSEKGICFPCINKAVRTGDTSADERRRMLKKPPHILITTPESLYLILTSPNARNMLSTVRYLIIDEIHTLLDNKRGVHMALSVERLSHLVKKPITRIGLSATVKPVDEAAKYLGGYEKVNEEWVQRPVTIIQPAMGREVDLKIDLPVKDYRTIEDKTIWPAIYRQVLRLVNSHTSTLVFVNNRAVAEKVAANVNNLAGKDIAKAHHGCISKESRLEVERQLKNGELPCLVATSSLELGIDVGAIDLVIQVASPKSAARGIQRLGRAGHRLNAISKGRIIPRTRGDLLESVIVSTEMLNGNIEETHVPMKSLDILAQHIVSMAWDREWQFNEIADVIKGAYSYQSLKEDELKRVLRMLAGEYEHREEHPVSPRIVWDSVNSMIRGGGYSRMLALGSGGTIPDRGYYGVYLEDGKTRIGELDEIFVFEARIGERFMLGTSAWRIEEIRRDRVIVSSSGASGAKTPFWTGDGLGRPYSMGVRFGRFLGELSQRAGTAGFLDWIMSYAPLDEIGAANLEQYVIDQKIALGCIPTDRLMVIEYFSDETGQTKAVVHSPFGGRVNGGLAIVLEHELSKNLHCQVETSYNDDGVLIGIMGYEGFPHNLMAVISPDRVEDILVEELPQTPLFSMTFRYNAARALMMGTQRRGKRTQLWAQRLRAMEVMGVAEKYKDHPLIVETFRECMEKVLDVPDLLNILDDIVSGKIQVVEKITTHPSPFTSEILFKFMGVMMYEGQMPDPKKTENKIISSREALNLEFGDRYKKENIDVRAIADVVSQNNPLKQEKSIKTPDELHSMLMTYGDIALSTDDYGTVDSMCGGSFNEWLDELKGEQRATEICFKDGCKIVVAAEETELYSSALSEPDSGAEKPWTMEEALYRIIKRYARYYSPLTFKDITARYNISDEFCERILKRLEEDQILIKGDYTGSNSEEWCHVTILDRIRKHTMKLTRESVKSKDIDSYAAALPSWQGVGIDIISPEEGLYDIIKKLSGLYLPSEWWEGFVFPSRIPGYRKIYLDRLCSTGRVAWRVKNTESTPKLAWFAAEDLEESENDAETGGLSDNEGKVYDVLNKKGASFIHILSAATKMETGELISTLEDMVWKGIVINDSFEPIRYFISKQPKSPKMMAMRRASAFKMDMGRWSICSALKDKSIEDYILMLFTRYGIVAKEIFQCEKDFYSWGEVYEVLKQWEYIGKVNRGYFIKGLSGVQYMLTGASSMFENINSSVIVLDACDPAMVFQKMVPCAIRQWNMVPGTAVVLKSGNPILVAEGYGERFIPISEDKNDVIQGICKFIEKFRNGAIWGLQKRIKMKTWNDVIPVSCEFAEELCSAGFEREMQDMVLWK